MKSALAAVLLACTLTVTGLAFASAPPAKQKAETEEGDEPAASSRSMDAPYLAVPVVRDGELVNYLFVSVRVEIAQGVDLWRTRERAQFLRDALVRASHANDLAAANDDNALNEPLAIQVYRTAANQALGERAVSGVSIVATYSSQGSGI